MPLGNLTSQFFANVYLNELDYFVKHKLKAKHYIRYVDDFIILHKNKTILENYKEKINYFLKLNLNLTLHQAKSRIIPLSRGIDFVGFRIFYHHKLLRKANLRRLKCKPALLKAQFDKQKLSYDDVYNSMLGSLAYTKQANTYQIRKSLENEYEKLFPGQISSHEYNTPLKLHKATPTSQKQKPF